ncbi:poly [ADP-ribose] polymerase 1-like isoform X4 [Microplitis mediator]|nr:poly [ADP-ribose] polymerase 1-like isoform X4 [Microplitis mediator]XP_057321749.1 poly [ADP-ribose] polymerase 1-like isoform X4 [Microplitis mediator]
MDNIKWEHQIQIKNKIDSKNPDNYDDDNQQIKISQNSQFFELRDQLINLPKNELKDLMKHNMQYYYFKKDFFFFDEVTDRILFGALKKCHKCKSGKLIFESGIGYKCMGMYKDIRCLTITLNPRRFKFKLKNEIKSKHEFLSREFQIGQRIINKPSLEAFRSNDSIEEENTIILRLNNELDHCSQIYVNKGETLSKMFVRTDIQLNQNKYYQLEVRKHHNYDRFWLLQKWGRIGTSRGDQKLQVLSREECLGEFTKISKKKEVSCSPVDQHFSMNKDEIFHNKVDIIKTNPTEPVEKLMKLIYDKNILKKKFKMYKIDLEEIPIGKVTTETIECAEKLLVEIQNKFTSNQPDKIFDLIAMTNKFYSLIPHAFGNKRPPIIDNNMKYRNELKKLKSLKEMNVPSNFNNPQSENNINPLDIFYQKLNVEIKVLNRDHEHFQIIQQYVENTHSSKHDTYIIDLLDIFFVEKHGSFHEKYEERSNNLGNKKWLWHGTSLTNISGILLNGLKIMPPEAHITGATFGQGIYFTDTVSKAANFSGTKKVENPIGILLLCEVALGNIKECNKNDSITRNPDGYDSIMGKGNIYPNIEESHTTPEGIIVPYGKLSKEHRDFNNFNHNEYIVYDPNQVKIQYLVNVEYMYKRYFNDIFTENF